MEPPHRPKPAPVCCRSFFGMKAADAEEGTFDELRDLLLVLKALVAPPASYCGTAAPASESSCS